MFTAGFQFVAFQTIWGGQSQQNVGGSPSYIYHPEWQKHQAQQIKKAKTETQKLESVINEYERRKALAEESLAIAEETERNRLLKLQNELIDEINRLLMVKAEMMARIKQAEELLILAIASRRKLRAFNLTTQRI